MKQIKAAAIFLSLLTSSLTPCMQEVNSVIAQLQKLQKHAGTLFVRAAWKGDLASITALAPYVDINSQINIDEEAREKVSALHMASNKGNSVGVRFLLQQKGIDVTIEDINGSTPLHEASGEGHNAVVKLLLSNGAQKNINRQNGLLDTPLMEACTFDHLDVVRTLIRANADVRIPSYERNLPIHKACERGFYNIAQYLIPAARSTVNAQNHNGDTPLHMASRFDRGLLAICLIFHKADPNIKNRLGHTALDCAKNDVMRGGLLTGELVIGPSPELDAFLTPIMQRAFALAPPALPAHSDHQEDVTSPKAAELDPENAELAEQKE